MRCSLVPCFFGSVGGERWRAERVGWHQADFPLDGVLARSEMIVAEFHDKPGVCIRVDGIKVSILLCEMVCWSFKDVSGHFAGWPALGPQGTRICYDAAANFKRSQKLGKRRRQKRGKKCKATGSSGTLWFLSAAVKPCVRRTALRLQLVV